VLVDVLGEVAESFECAELDVDADGADALSAAATPQPAVIEAPSPSATRAPPTQPECGASEASANRKLRAQRNPRI
jgi:hypothetical protein